MSKAQNELWKPVSGFEEFYEVSNLGRVRRSGNPKGTFIGRVLKPFPTKKGYLMVRLCRDGTECDRPVHLLVARAFIGEPPAGYQADHIDGNKGNCAATNLEYVTGSENIRRAFKLGLRVARRGSLNGSAKLKETDIVEVFKMRKQGKSQREIGEHLGVTQANVSLILKGAAWKHASGENNS